MVGACLPRGTCCRVTRCCGTPLKFDTGVSLLAVILLVHACGGCAGGSERDGSAVDPAVKAEQFGRGDDQYHHRKVVPHRCRLLRLVAP
jgi:hypothetical protein